MGDFGCCRWFENSVRRATFRTANCSIEMKNLLCVGALLLSSVESKLIDLQENLTPEPNRWGEKEKVQKLLYDIAKDNENLLRSGREPIGSKRPVLELGTKDMAYGNYRNEKGFFSTVYKAYANHWVLSTTPEDWWFSIIRKVALDIDAASTKDVIRNIFVSHEGKRELKVVLGPSIYTANYSNFLEKMSEKIEDNLNNPSYVEKMKSDFTTSTLTHKIVANIAIMSSVQEYFTYTGSILCGIPKIEMKGSEEDWQKLKDKVNALFEYIPSEVQDAIGEQKWWPKVKTIVNKLLQTYQGNPDKEWWSKIITQVGGGGCGGPPKFDGWFLKEFLHEEKFKDLPSGVVIVPMKIEQDNYTENAVLVGGIAGNRIEENYNDQNFTIIEAAHGWTLMLEPNSTFVFKANH